MFHICIYAPLAFFKHLRIAVAIALAVAIGLFAFLTFPVEPVDAASMTFTLDATIITDQTIGSGETWTVNSGVTLTIRSGVNIINGGTISNSGTIKNFGFIDNFGTIVSNFGTIDNFGTILTNSGATFGNNFGTVNNSGIFSNFCISGGSCAVTNSGTINNNSGGTIHSFGTFTSSGTIVTNSGTTITNFGTFTNSGTISNSGIIGNFGTFTNSGTINNFGTINNNLGTINNSGGTINNNSGGTISNGGTINNSARDIRFRSTITNSGTIGNVGTINNNFGGTINNKCGATFINLGTYTGNPVNNEPCSYDLDLFEGSDPSDGIVNLSQEVTARAQTNDVSVDDVTFRWKNQAGNTIETEIVQLSLSGQAESSFAPNEVGDWTVEADFNNGVVVRETVIVPFSVIPESPIGVAALIGSSLAALGGFVLLRRNHTNRHSRSPNDTGI